MTNTQNELSYDDGMTALLSGVWDKIIGVPDQGQLRPTLMLGRKPA